MWIQYLFITATLSIHFPRSHQSYFHFGCHVIPSTLKHISLSLILTFTCFLFMSTNILVVFVKDLRKIRGILGSSLISITMISTGNESFSILILTSLMIPVGVLDVLSAICKVVLVGSILRSPIFYTTNNGIKFTLAPKSMVHFQLPRQL